MARKVSAEELDEELFEEDSTEEVVHEVCECRFSIVNRLYSFLVGGLSYTAWIAMYNALADKLDGVTDLIIFTVVIAFFLVLVTLWHYQNSKKLAKAAKHALSVKAHPTGTELWGALMEKTYGNISDAMGYVLVNAWITVYPIPNTLAPLVIALIVMACVCVLLFILEVLERSTEGAPHEIFMTAGTVIASGASWFVVGPLVKSWCSLDGMAECQGSDPNLIPAWWLTGLAFAFGVIFHQLVGSLFAHFFGADEIETEDDPLETAMAEKVLYFIKAGCLYTGGTLLKIRIFKNELPLFDNVWLYTFLFAVCAVISALVLEKLQNRLAACCDKQGPDLAFWMKFETELVSNYTKILGWITSKLVCQGMTVTLPKAWATSHPFWWVFAFLCQAGSLAAEEFRVRRLHAMVAEQEAGMQMALEAIGE
eukprot:gnl/TRDRNA2_/TRDRNA2_181856_c0_seq1.p1 gnl/TRDRNA2_/TRDRNA2_181856_c0~~gnl/TRDRNA2_/TRDRNA2_181856_c0_seq1.p1  ORF type:complete len:424 (+),score=65.26 gnl/TRDRNA2_/TRDRNA2_181856_c0_seq1:71-1342(+)